MNNRPTACCPPGRLLCDQAGSAQIGFQIAIEVSKVVERTATDRLKNDRGTGDGAHRDDLNAVRASCRQNCFNSEISSGGNCRLPKEDHER